MASPDGSGATTASTVGPRRDSRPGQPLASVTETSVRIQGTAPHPVRLRLLAKRLHSLGERPLYEWLVEIANGANPWLRLERYAKIAPLAGFIAANEGDRLPPAARIVGGRHGKP